MIKKKLAFVILATLCIGDFLSCSNENGLAGTFIETNTGNKILIETNSGAGYARVVLDVKSYSINVGDTLQIFRTEKDTIGDTIQTNCYYLQKIAENEDTSAGLITLENVPEGYYDSLSIIPIDGEIITVAVNIDVQENESYFYKNEEIIVNKKASITLPEGFSDLAFSDEIFENMPFIITLESDIKNPCLMDKAGKLIYLDFSQSNDSSVKKYWGQMPKVIFSEQGTIDFDILENCQESDSIGLILGRYVEHFGNYALTDSATEALKDREELYGNSLWTTTSDDWFYIDNFKPFVEDYNMTASIWINALGEIQPTTSIRLLSAKKDSVGFILQQRTDRSGVNLRIDAGSDAYNQTFGYAKILDGKWHNYSFRIRKDSVAIFVDGILIQEAAIKSGNGFSAAYNPAVGGDKYNLIGGLDEIMFFDGSQSNNWMRLFYALQKKL